MRGRRGPAQLAEARREIDRVALCEQARNQIGEDLQVGRDDDAGAVLHRATSTSPSGAIELGDDLLLEAVSDADRQVAGLRATPAGVPAARAPSAAAARAPVREHARSEPSHGRRSARGNPDPATARPQAAGRGTEHLRGVCAAAEPCAAGPAWAAHEAGSATTGASAGVPSGLAGRWFPARRRWPPRRVLSRSRPYAIGAVGSAPPANQPCGYGSRSPRSRRSVALASS